MKYPFDTVKMFNKLAKITSPLMSVCGYTVDISTHNFICETVDDQVCHSISLTIHSKVDIVFQVSINNWTDPKKNKQLLKELKLFVDSQLV